MSTTIVRSGWARRAGAPAAGVAVAGVAVAGVGVAGVVVAGVGVAGVGVAGVAVADVGVAGERWWASPLSGASKTRISPFLLAGGRSSYPILRPAARERHQPAGQFRPADRLMRARQISRR